MKVIEITEEKRSKMSEHVESILHSAGRLMDCIENLDGDDVDYRRRHDYDDRDYMRDYENDRRSRRTGRYM